MTGRRFGFGLFTLVMIVAFVGLGAWQLQRRLEKHALCRLHALPKRRVHDQQARRTQWIKPVLKIEAKWCKRRTCRILRI